MYTTLLKRDDKNRYALEALGYLSRDEGDNKAAETFFTRMAAAFPNDYVPYTALGDLYTAIKAVSQGAGKRRESPQAGADKFADRGQRFKCRH